MKKNGLNKLLALLLALVMVLSLAACGNKAQDNGAADKDAGVARDALRDRPHARACEDDALVKILRRFRLRGQKADERRGAGLEQPGDLRLARGDEH